MSRRLVLTLLVCMSVMQSAVAVSSAQESPLRVVTSIRPLALLAQDLLEDLAHVEVLVPPNADPHNLSLKVSDRIKLESAGLVLWLGEDFERFLSKVIKQRNPASQLSVESIPGLFLSQEDELHTDEQDHELDGHHHAQDLHVWLNPEHAIDILSALYVRVSDMRPNWEQRLKGRLDVLSADIVATSSSIKTALLPYRQVSYGVAHDAYGHFAEAYDLRDAVVISRLPEQRLSAKQLHILQLRMRGAKCLLVERSSEKMKRLARVLKVPQVEIDPLVSNMTIQSYTKFLNELGRAFQACFQS